MHRLFKHHVTRQRRNHEFLVTLNLDRHTAVTRHNYADRPDMLIKYALLIRAFIQAFFILVLEENIVLAQPIFLVQLFQFFVFHQQTPKLDIL